jgi:hypothetical protein
MAKMLKIGRKETPVGIDPELKDFIDRVIVPALVREYRALDRQNDLASDGGRVAHCAGSTAAETLRGDARP